MKNFTACVVLALSCWAANAQLAAVRTLEGITEYALPNGLQVLLVPDATKPVATVNLTYRVGSRHEGAGETGSAHLLEHMLFKASGKIEDPKRDMQTLGMRWNGTTWFDRTNYFAHFLSNDAPATQRMDFMLGWLAGMMTQAKFTRADLDTEMTVVRNEFERAENEPGRVLGDRMRAVAFNHHGYRHSVLGAKSDIENVRLETLYAFYRKHYRPDNATLVIAGRFDVEAVKQKISAEFGPIAKPALPLPTTYTQEAVQDGERTVMLRRVGGIASTAVLYKMPAGGTREGVAARVLAETLSQRGGPLVRALTLQKLSVTEYAYYTATREPGFLIAGIGLPEKSEGTSDDQYRVKAFSSAAALAKVVEIHQPLDAEVQTARKTLLAGWRSMLRDAEATGQALSEMVAMGDWRLIFSVRDALAAITAEEVRTLARSYLLASNRTAGTYLPMADSNAAQLARAPATLTPNINQLVSSDTTLVSQKTDSQTTAVAATATDVVKADNFELTPAQVQQRTQRGQLTVAGTPGLQLAVLPRSSKDNRVVGTLRLRWGTTESLKGTAVLASLLGSQLLEGTDKSAAPVIKERLQALDASISFTSSTGFLNGNLEFPAANTAEVLRLLDELLRSSTFAQPAFERSQRLIVSTIEGLKTAPASVAGVTLERMYKPNDLYVAGDPRETRTLEQAQSQTRAITVTDLKSYWKRFASAQTGELVLLGPVDIAVVQPLLQSIWADWGSTEPHLPWVFLSSQPAPDSARSLSIVIADKANASYAARLGIRMNEDDPDFPALYAAIQILSFQGLRERIREKEGLSYGVDANLTVPTRGTAAAINITASFAPANLARLRAAVREVLIEKRASGFSALEVNFAKSAIVARRVEQRTVPANTVAGIANNLRFNLPLSRGAKFDEAYQQLDAATVNAALKKYLDPDLLWDVAAGSF